MARANMDGTRRRERAGRGAGTIGTREAARAARAHGIRLTAGGVAGLCEAEAFEAFPSVPWSEAAKAGGWEWCIDPKDFGLWCEWEAARRGC